MVFSENHVNRSKSDNLRERQSRKDEILCSIHDGTGGICTWRRCISTDDYNCR